MFADLSGKVALVTGGGQGLGLGIVLKLAGQGADIAIGDLSDENAAAAAKQVEALGRKAYVANMNVTDKGTIAAAVEKFNSEAGQIDILVNNAGVAGAPGSTGTGFRDVDWDFTWQVNVKGLADVTEAVLPQMRERKNGKIITSRQLLPRLRSTRLPITQQPRWLSLLTRRRWLVSSLSRISTLTPWRRVEFGLSSTRTGWLSVRLSVTRLLSAKTSTTCSWAP